MQCYIVYQKSYLHWASFFLERDSPTHFLLLYENTDQITNSVLCSTYKRKSHVFRTVFVCPEELSVLGEKHTDRCIPSAPSTNPFGDHIRKSQERCPPKYVLFNVENSSLLYRNVLLCQRPGMNNCRHMQAVGLAGFSSAISHQTSLYSGRSRASGGTNAKTMELSGASAASSKAAFAQPLCFSHISSDRRLAEQSS